MEAKKTFSRGGVHPHENKNLADPTRYERAANPAELRLHLNQHLGKPASSLVKPRQKIAALEKVGEASGYVSVNLHSPLAGSVKKISTRNLLGMQGEALEIAVDEGQEAFPGYEQDPPEPDVEALSPSDIVAKIKDAGLVGMGGAAFPTHVKLVPPEGLAVDTVILNGAECEPYLTADDCLMRNHPRQVIYGLLLAMKAAGADKGIVALEDNKPEAQAELRRAAKPFKSISVVEMKTLYPQGSEKQLIQAVSGRVVPCGKLPANVGIVVQNVATSAAIYEAVQFNRPLVRRLVTVSGRAVAKPQNLLVPIGISASELLALSGGLAEEAAAVLFGGPMMGRTTNRLDTPVTKGTSGILFMTREELGVFEERECLRCGNCAKVCPMGLVPVDIMNKVKFGLIEKIDEFDRCIDEINSCFECGSCTFACPANKKLTEWTRLAKYELRRSAAKKKGTSK